MITRAKLDELNPEQRTAVFKELLTAVYGTPKPLQREVAYYFDISAVTWRNWIRHDRVPTMAILLMQELALSGSDTRTEIKQWNELAADMADMAEFAAIQQKQFGKITQTLADLAATRVALLEEIVSPAASSDRASAQCEPE